MSKEGSRHVSLGPYRSTEIALEDRLTKKEAKDLFKNIQDCSFGGVANHEVGHDDLVKILKNLGYEEKTECLYTRAGFVNNDVLLNDRFVYLSKTSKGLMRVISGSYDSNPDKVLADIKIIEDIEPFYCKRNPPSLEKASFIIPMGIGMFGSLMSTGYPEYVGLADIALIASACALSIAGFSGYYSIFNRKITNKAIGLSASAMGYLYGNVAYQQIISEHFSFLLPENKPKKLETSESKQLPETKENPK